MGKENKLLNTQLNNIIEKIQSTKQIGNIEADLFDSGTNNYLSVEDIEDGYLIETDRWDIFITKNQAAMLFIILTAIYNRQS